MCLRFPRGRLALAADRDQGQNLSRVLGSSCHTAGHGDGGREMGIVIVGASGGIGRALIEILGPHSALFAIGRNETSLADLGLPYAVADVGDESSYQSAMDQAATKLGEIKGLVNLAGAILLKPAHLTTASEWEHQVRQNLSSAFYTCKMAGLFMKSGGSVVLMSSAAARHGLTNHEAVAATKAGIHGLVMSAAATYAARKLRFNAVAPGLVDTPLAAPITRSEAALKVSQSMHPLGRIGRPEEVATVIAMLLESEWITGQVIGVDGGLGVARSR